MTDDAQGAEDSVVASEPGQPISALSTSRRGIVAAACASLLLAAPRSVAATRSPGGRTAESSEPSTVIVIGGGFCGVTAARELRGRGHKVVLLEARNRLGGRTFTADFAGEPADLGGTWVHWLQPHVWSEIQRYGMKLKETPGAVAEDIVYLDYQGGRHQAKASQIWKGFEESVARFLGSAYEIMPRPAEPFADDKWVKADIYSIQQKLDSTELAPDMKILVDTWCTVFASAPAKEAAWIDIVRFYALSGYSATLLNDTTTRYKIDGGTRMLLDAIAAEAAADVKLATPVRSVRQLDDKIEVIAEDGSRFTADAAVVAVPMNVLKDIAFSPALSAPKLEVSKQTHAGNGTKVHILLDKAYPIFSGWAPSGNTPINFLLWDGIKDGKTHLIAFGPSRNTLDVNDTAAVEVAVRQFLPDARVVEAYGYEWGADPYSQGVWGISRPGQMSKFIGALQQAQGRIQFANADWANGWRGSIDGAIEQGLVAAREVHLQLQQLPKRSPGTLVPR